MCSSSPSRGGVRRHFGSSDAAPFVTLGMALASLEADRKKASDLEGEGLVGFAEIGLDVLRTNQFGGAAVLCLDMPAFTRNVTVVALC